jgi:hypothetical protein
MKFFKGREGIMGKMAKKNPSDDLFETKVVSSTQTRDKQTPLPACL